MGSSASRIGVQRGPSGTAFIGDLRQEAKYGLNLKTHPVQDVIAKSEPLHYIGNTLYPKVGAKLMLVPRQFALAPTNNGLPFGYWRYSRHTALFMKVFLGVFIMHVLAAKANFGTQYNVSWRGGDSVLYGNAGKALKEEMELADKLGKMYK